FSKTSRSFAANGGATTVGAAVENLVPRAPKVEPEETPVVEPIAEPEKPLVSDFEREVVSAPITEVAEFSSVGEPQVIESAEEIPAAPKEEPVFAETPVWTEPAAPEPAWMPITPEPAWMPTAFEPSTPVFETPAPVEEMALPVAETSASFESVSEPV